MWATNYAELPNVCCNRECDCEQYDPVEDEDILHRKVATCPVCERERVLVNAKGIVLSHSAPEWAYRDGRACLGVGKVAVEYRKKPYTGKRHVVRFPDKLPEDKAHLDTRGSKI